MKELFVDDEINSVDSIIEMMHSPRSTWNVTSFYTNMIPMVTSVPVKSTDGTYTQMKTSGTLRYFNQSLVNIVKNDILHIPIALNLGQVTVEI